MTAKPITMVRPTSVEGIRKAFAGRKRLSSLVEFSRPSRTENHIIMRSRLRDKLRFALVDQVLSYEYAGQKLALNLDAFDVKTEIEGDTLIFQVKAAKRGQPIRGRVPAIEKTKNPVLVRRVLNALAEIEEELPKERIDAASAAPSDYMVLYEVMTEPAVATRLAEKDPLATAKLRGVKQQRQLLEQFGGVFGVSEVAELLNLSRQAVDKRRRSGQLIGLTRGRRGYVYPAWQFDDGKTLPHLEEVLDALSEHDPWMQLLFFVNPNDRLDERTPLDLLRSGQPDRVLVAARSYNEHGAS